MDYNNYNREERDLCAHLFRLLLLDQVDWKPLKELLNQKSIDNPRLFCEVALIRDAYFIRKPKVREYIEDLCDSIAERKHIKYTKFKDLPDELNDPTKTHPRQIVEKMRKRGYGKEDIAVYGSLRAVFNAKPDLVICEGNNLHVFEIKYTLDFDGVQIRRTIEIAELWKKLLYSDLGFDNEPEVSVMKIGMNKYHPDISWEHITEIAARYLANADFSNRAFQRIKYAGVNGPMKSTSI